jgi:hypothetical protein
MSLHNKWVAVTPGGTPCLYSNEGRPLYSKSPTVAAENCLKDTRGMYKSWTEMLERGYTLELLKEAR